MREIFLDEMKAIELEILKYIDCVCKENNIEYFLGAGTLIGAVRHKGFIPWDDDIDIFMKREDYIRFIQITRGHNRYKTLSLYNDLDYYYPWAKVVDTNTVVIDTYSKKFSNNGVRVDIFPLDYANENVDFTMMTSLNKKFNLSSFKKLYPSKSIIKKIIKSLVFIFYKYRDPKKIAFKIDKLSQEFGNKKDEFLYIGLSQVGKKDFFKKEWFSSSINLEFENCFFKCPIGYDEVLKNRYGDYMKVPPKSQQVSTHSFKAYIKEDIK